LWIIAVFAKKVTKDILVWGQINWTKMAAAFAVPAIKLI
jgi:hypothetical protein